VYYRKRDCVCKSKSGRISRVNYGRTAVTIIFVAAPAITAFARSSHSSSSTDNFGTFLTIGVVLVVGLVLAVINATKKPKRLSKEQAAQLQAEAMELGHRIETGQFTPPDTPLILGKDEIALLNESSRLLEARATRLYAGGGTRVKGIYIGGGQSTSVQSLKELDSGTLTLTTKRLVFTGSMESRAANVKDIVSVEPAADAIQVSTKRAKRQVYLVRNPIIWTALLTTVTKGGISLKKTPPTEKPLVKSPEVFGGSELLESAQLPQPEARLSRDITFNCPHCDQHLAVEAAGAGMTVNCPHCNEQIEIPRENSAA
jgi:hypothetical protein